MNVGKNKRVILVNGDKSKWYEQAIFIVKKNLPEKNVPVDFVAEAEKVIDAYINRTSRKKASRGADIIVNVLLLMTCIVLAVLLFFLI